MQKRFKYLFLIPLLSLTTQLACAHRIQKDVIYDRVDDIDLKMDVYAPSQTRDFLSPVIIYLHGGCFYAGSKNDISESVKNMTEDGFTVVSVDYRPSTIAKYPAAVTDVQQAVRYIRKNSVNMRVNAEKIFAHGESAGGYLAAVLGTRLMPDREGKMDVYSARVPYVSDWYGRTDFTRPQKQGEDCAASFLGIERNKANKEKFREASILPYINSESASFHIVHGTEDAQVVPYHSEILAWNLFKSGKPAVVLKVEGGKHGIPATGLPWDLTRQFFLLNR